MEMLAIYFALVDNQQNIRKVAKGLRKKHLVINIQSDSMTCVEQLRGVSEVRDSIMRRIYAVIKNLLARMSFLITFNYLDRNRNIAGLLLEQRRRREEERRIAHWSEKQISTFSSIDIAPVISYKVSAA